MATVKTIFNSTSLDCVLELLYLGMGVRLDPDFVTYSLNPTSSRLTITALPTAADGRKGLYTGMVNFTYAKLDLEKLLPQDLVYSDVYPVTFEHLQSYLKTAYDYAMEEGEFSLASDASNTPLVAGSVINATPDELTRQIQLRVTAQAGRWIEGGLLTVTVAAPASLPSTRQVIVTGDAPNGTAGQAYTTQYQATGGQAPYTWSVVDGTPPAAIDPTTGIMSTDQVTVGGSLAWTVRVTDDAGRIVDYPDTCTITVQPMALTDPTLNVVYNTPYSFPLVVTGGVPPYTVNKLYPGEPMYWRETDILSDGTLVGTPTYPGQSISFQVVDSVGTSFTRTYTLHPTFRDDATIVQALWSKLVAWYTFDDGNFVDGATIRDVHQGLSLTLHGNGAVGYSAVNSGLVPRQEALQLTGNQWMDSAAAALQLTDKFTVVGWLGYPSFTDGAVLIGQNNGGAGWQIRTSTDGAKNLECSIIAGGQTYSVLGYNQYFTANVKNLMAFSWDGQFLTSTCGPNSLYSSYWRTPAPMALDATGLPLTLGRRADGIAGTSWTGWMDDWAIFNDDLLFDELTWLVNAGTGRSYAELKALALGTSYPALTLSGSLASGNAGQAYSCDLPITGGDGTYSNVRLLNGTLPAGLSLSIVGSAVRLSGTASEGVNNVALTIAVDSGDSQTTSLVAYLQLGWPTLTLTGSLPNGQVGTAYSADLSVSGGSGVYYGAQVASGYSLPSGLSLTQVDDTLTISGIPTAQANQTVVFKVLSSDGQTATKTLVITINASSDLISELLLSGANGSTSFPDTQGIVWSASGSVAISTAYDDGFGNGTGALFGTTDSDYLVTPSDPVWDLGSSDFTIEAFVRLNAAPPSYAPIIGKHVTNGADIPRISFLFGFNAGALSFSLYHDSTTSQIDGSSAFPINSRHKVAVVRSGTQLALLIDDVVCQSVAIGAVTMQFDSSIGVTIGHVVREVGVEPGLIFPGIIEKLRVWRVAKYSTLLDPYHANVISLFKPITGFSTIVDTAGPSWSNGGSPAASVETTNGLDGWHLHIANSDTIQSAYNAGYFALGTGDFTIEMCVQFDSLSNGPCLFDFRPTETNGPYPEIGTSPAGAIGMWVNNGQSIVSGDGVLSVGTPHHIELSRSSGQTRLFVDGQQVGSTFADGNNYLGDQVRLFENAFTSTQRLDGYLFGFRITEGACRHAANFTVDQYPFPSA